MEVAESLGSAALLTLHRATDDFRICARYSGTFTARGGDHAPPLLRFDDNKRRRRGYRRRTHFIVNLRGVGSGSGRLWRSLTPAPALTTAWGEPDLQGIWTDETDTPMQRPAKYASQEFFTDEQRAELDKLRSALPRAGDERNYPMAKVAKTVEL